MRGSALKSVVGTALAGALLAACTGAAASSAPSAPSSVGSPAPSSTPLASGGAPSTSAAPITLADNGSSRALRVGDRVLLQLGTDFEWTVSVDDSAIVDRVRNITVVNGAQGVYEALAPGTTILTATGDPPCRKATPPCGAPSILFQVTLTVGS